MSAPIQPQAGGHFWLFDDRQLDAALDDWAQTLRGRQCDPLDIGLMTDSVRKFMHSAYCVNHGMRRGGTEA